MRKKFLILLLGNIYDVLGYFWPYHLELCALGINNEKADSAVYLNISWDNKLFFFCYQQIEHIDVAAINHGLWPR